MSIKSLISDYKNGNTANIKKLDTDDNSLIVSAHPYKEYEYKIKFFTNPNYGIEIAQEIISPTLQEDIYFENLGNPNEWQFSSIIGAWNFSSISQVYAGTYSIDATNLSNNSIAQAVPPGGSFTVSSDYIYLDGYIYLTSWSVLGAKQFNIYAYNTITATTVGNVINIGNYINKNLLNQWQYFIIPIKRSSKR